MKAAILAESRAPLVVADIEMPEQLSFGQVRVRVLYSSICGAQINEIDAVKGPDKFLPHLLGHEGSGIVEETGPGVKTVKKGDHVVLHWRQTNAIQSETPKYRWGDKVVNSGWVTTFNEMAVISENRLTPIPADFDMTLAPLFGCAVTTAIGVINNDAQVKVGQSVVIFGIGGVGLNLCQAAELVGASEIIGVDIFDEKLAYAQKFGATHVFNSKTDPAYLDKIQALVGGKGADVVIDTTGVAGVIETAYDLTHADGRTILVGVPKEKIQIYSLPLHFKKVLKGSHGGSTEPHIDIPRYIRLYKAGKLKLDGLITKRYKLDDINVALSDMRNGSVGRCLIEMV